MTQYPTQTRPTPEQDKQAGVKASAQLTDAEKKAEADKVKDKGASSTTRT